MASPDDNGGMLRRMVKMVAGGPRDSALASDASLSQFAEAEKAELKAMIERKRRNDFVRKRELNMLRRIRREGLTPDQAAALDASSRIDDSEVRITQAPGGDGGVKAKIDAIEQQMVGLSPRHAPLPQSVRTQAATEAQRAGRGDAAVTVPVGMVTDSSLGEGTRPMMMMPAEADPPRPSATRPVPPASKVLPTLTEPLPTQPAVTRTAALPSVEVSEVLHDHELDEAVIAFANADFSHAERQLTALLTGRGSRTDHADTWLTLLDLFRATGQQQRFEAMAEDYSQRFQTSPPQWYSLPRLVADASASGMLAPVGGAGDIGWVCPPTMDSEAVTDLISRSLQLPKPWVLDWTAVRHIDADAVNRLYRLLRDWGGQALEMRWLASDRLFVVLQEAAPVGVRDADPGYWLARLEALRLTNRPDQFDEVAIDYCVTYEVSPPSWEPTRCIARVGGSTLNTRSAALSVIGDAVTTVHGQGETQGIAITTLDLSGQLAGDIGPVLKSLDAKLGGAQVVRISCALLIRVDFIAAGDLLNWIISRKGEGRHISFVDAHRLVAAMFGAMGIGEHAPVHLRQA